MYLGSLVFLQVSGLVDCRSLGRAQALESQPSGSEYWVVNPGRILDSGFGPEAFVPNSQFTCS